MCFPRRRTCVIYRLALLRTSTFTSGKAHRNDTFDVVGISNNQGERERESKKETSNLA